jgi:hypothetical protein
MHDIERAAIWAERLDPDDQAGGGDRFGQARAADFGSVSESPLITNLASPVLGDGSVEHAEVVCIS